MVGLIVLQIVLNQKLAQDVLRYLIERVEYLLSANAIPRQIAWISQAGAGKSRSIASIGAMLSSGRSRLFIKENETQLI